MEHQNYCTVENGAKICNVSSTLPNCSADNILQAERKQLWMSLAGLPQYITVDLSGMRERPKFIKCFGFDCWHDYQSNPSVIELMVSTDGENYITWITVYPELKQGIQVFQIDPLGRRYQFIKIIIKETFGASKTYMNQIYLMEEYTAITTESVSESQHQTENNSQFRNAYEREEVEEKEDVVPRNEYQQLAMKIESMGKEVASLKQSNANRQLASQQPIQQVSQQQFYTHSPIYQHSQQKPQKQEEQFNNNNNDQPILTSSEKMVQGLKREIIECKEKNQSLEQQVVMMHKLLTQLVEKQQQQDQLIQNLTQQQQQYNNQQQSIQAQLQQPQQISVQRQQSQPSDRNISQPSHKDQVKQFSPKEILVQQSKLEEVFDQKISELTETFEQLLQQQETKFKAQQDSLTKKIQTLLQVRTVRTPQRSKSRSISQSSSSVELRHARHSKSRQNSRQRQRSYSKENDRHDQNRMTPQPKQKKVASLLGKLQEKLQQRARKIEQLNLSQKKTRKRSSRLSDDSQSSSNY